MQGFVQLYHDGQWGSICDDGLDQRGRGLADVLCRMKGFANGKYLGNSFGRDYVYGSKIWLDQVSARVPIFLP